MRRIHLATYFFALGLLLFGAQRAHAQTDARGWEAGGQFSIFNVTNGEATTATVVPCISSPCPVITATAEQRRTEPGFGGRVGYNFNRYLSAEAEVNFFPRERALTDPEFTGGRKFQGLFGVKVGRRYEHVGLFAKARPGFVDFDEGDLRQRPGTACVAIFPPPLSCFESTARTDFAFDAGGVVELYPSAHAVIRFDAGDTVLRTGAHNIPGRTQISPTGPTFNTVLLVPSETTHNFQGSVGFAFRF
jgi:hypothetical protein